MDIGLTYRSLASRGYAALFAEKFTFPVIAYMFLRLRRRPFMLTKERRRHSRQCVGRRTGEAQLLRK
jgi:hypothetical protein